MNMIRKMIVLPAMLSAVCWAGALDVPSGFKVIKGEATGVTRQDAINSALCSALGQTAGINLTETKRVVLSESNVSADGDTSSLSSDEFSMNLRTYISGRVRSYEVVRAEQQGTRWEAVVDAVIPDQYVIGNNPDNRRKLVVRPFQYKETTKEVFGQAYRLSAIAERLGEHLNDRMTRSRKFTVLDRDFEKEAFGELEGRLADPNTRPDDALVRSMQKLMTDYIVVGTLRLYDPPPVITDPIRGNQSMDPNATFLEFHYRVLLAATGQLKWSDTQRVPFAAIDLKASADDNLSRIAAVAARNISRDMFSDIMPIRVVGNDGKELTLNTGDDLEAGEVMVAYAVGNVIPDHYTGESLGENERPVAQIQVTSVLPKHSYASVAGNYNIADIPKGSIVRRMDGPPKNAPPVARDAPAPAPPPPPGLKKPGLYVLPTSATPGILENLQRKKDESFDRVLDALPQHLENVVQASRKFTIRTRGMGEPTPNDFGMQITLDHYLDQPITRTVGGRRYEGRVLQLSGQVKIINADSGEVLDMSNIQLELGGKDDLTQETTSLEAMLPKLSRKFAEQSYERLMAVAFPMKILDAEDGIITINRGEEFLAVGDKVEIFGKSRTIVDEDTGGKINVKGKSLGFATITSVDVTYSQAKADGVFEAPNGAEVRKVQK